MEEYIWKTCYADMQIVYMQDQKSVYKTGIYGEWMNKGLWMIMQKTRYRCGGGIQWWRKDHARNRDDQISGGLCDWKMMRKIY